jgi:protein SCO1
MKNTNMYILFGMTIMLACQLSFAGSNWPEMSLFNLNSKWKSEVTGEKELSGHLAGQVTVLAMGYTSCEHTCPIIISKMSSIRRALPEHLQNKIKLVLVSFDPKRDTVEQLKKYKKKRKLVNGWTFLTGNISGVRQIAAILGVNYKEESDGAFSHSNIISVIDGRGVVVSQMLELNGNKDQLVKDIKKQFK